MGWEEGGCGFDSSHATTPEPPAQGAGFGFGPLGPGYDFNNDGKVSLLEQFPPPNVIDDLYDPEPPRASAHRSSSSGCFDTMLGCFSLIFMLVAGAAMLWLLTAALL